MIIIIGDNKSKLMKKKNSEFKVTAIHITMKKILHKSNKAIVLLK